MDIADIGFRADTSDLEKAVLTLNKLQKASMGVSTTSNKVTQAIEGTNRATAQAAVEVTKAARAKAKANYDAMKATGSATKADMEAARQALAVAKAEESKARSLLASAKANAALEKATMSNTSAMMRQESMIDRINRVTGVSRGRKSAEASMGVFEQNNFGLKNDQMPNRFNTANIAAQFQDIGVTAAMGMNPLTVALQQGTQLSAILNTMESPLKGLGIAFRSIINPVSLIAIGLTALVVAGIQFVNWAQVAQNVMMGLADVIDMAAPYVLSLGAALAVLYAPAIITGIASVITSIAMMGKTALVSGAQMAAAWIIGMGPIAWVAAGIAVVLAAMFAFREELANLIGVDVLGVIKNGVNTIIGVFVGGFNGIKAAWGVLPAAIGDIMIKTANNILGTIERTIMDVVARINKLPGVQIDLEFDGQGNIANPFEDQAKEAGALMAAEMEKALEKDYVGAVGDAVGNLTSKLRTVAAGIDTSGADGKKKKGGKTDLEHYEDIINGANRRIASLKTEQAALGLTEEAAAKLKYEQDMLNQAMQKGIDLTPQQRQELEELAGTMASIEEETRKAKEAMDFARNTTDSFFKDMSNGLRNGKTLWESFSDAVVNALNKILDRMIDSGIDMIFDSLGGSGIFGGGSGGSNAGGGFWGSLGNIFGGGVTANADGNAFTNGIYTNPTLFKFANGGSFGVMGEAGPEAVMPLHRGSDGSLGVRMEGGGSAQNVTVNVYGGNGNTQVDQRQTGDGIEIDVMIDEIVAQKLGEPGTLTNRALIGHNNKSLISR